MMLFFLGFILPQESFPFSFGKIEIKSNFGEKFRANLVIGAEGSSIISVAVGSHID
jgi:hypothetical protein